MDGVHALASGFKNINLFSDIVQLAWTQLSFFIKLKYHPLVRGFLFSLQDTCMTTTYMQYVYRTTFAMSQMNVPPTMQSSEVCVSFQETRQWIRGIREYIKRHTVYRVWTDV